MDNLTASAKKILIENDYTCVLYSKDRQYHSSLRGVRPLIDFLESGTDFSGFAAADKVVGAGAAHLYVLLKVTCVWAKTISQEAFSILEQKGISVFCEETVPFIINRAKDGVCPIENAFKGVVNSKDAYTLIKQTLKNLNKN